MVKIYLKESQTELVLGDFIKVNGITVEITESLIENNPLLFVKIFKAPEFVKCVANNINFNELFGKHFTVGRIYKTFNNRVINYNSHYCAIPLEQDMKGYYGGYDFIASTEEDFKKQELMDLIKTKYKVGDRCIMGNESFIITSDEFYQNNHNNGKDTIRCKCGDNKYAYIYNDGVFADISKIRYVSRDGVNLYDGDLVWYVDITLNDNVWDINNIKLNNKHVFDRDNGADMVLLSTEKAAKDWVKLTRSSVYDSAKEIIRNSFITIINK